jgi:hypothetical protein
MFTPELIDRILYHLDQLLGMYGYGEEYRKVAKTALLMYEAGADVSKYYHICMVLHLGLNKVEHNHNIDK